MNQLANENRLVGEWKKAIQLFEQLSEKDAAVRGPLKAGSTLNAVMHALTYLDAGLPAEGAARIDKVRECRIKTGVTIDSFFEHARSVAYQRAGRLDEADHVLRELDINLRKQGVRKELAVARNLEVLSVNLLLQHRYSEAEQPARESIALYEKNDKAYNRTDEYDWRLPYVKNLLGGALLGQKKYAEAEPLLVQGYENMKRAEATMTANWRYRLPEAGERVIRYYEETNQPEKAREWQEKLQEDKSKK
jgi:hypothetical protein